MISKLEIDNGFDYYKLDHKYKERCYKCAEIINENAECLDSFMRVFELLNYDKFSNIIPYWDIKSKEEIFCKDIHPFSTNLLIVLSYKTHKDNINQMKLDDEQIQIHKKRVKECFENDLEKRGYDSIRISQMLWAIYFIRIRLIEIGRLQYEYVEESLIKIHIPSGEKLNYESVKDSLNKAQIQLKKVFNIKDVNYTCHSWLLSNELNKIIDQDSNISKFYSLFDVTD